MTAKFREIFLLIFISHLLVIPMVIYLMDDIDGQHRFLFFLIYLIEVSAIGALLAYAAERLNPIWQKDQGFDIPQQDKLDNNNFQERFNAIIVYSGRTLLPYIPFHSIELLISDIQKFNNDGTIIEPILDNKKLTQVDFRHYAWNIGERLHWNGEQRARFIKLCFPREMGSSEVETIRRNLKTKRQCIIPLDAPDPGSFQFHYSSQAITQ